MPDIQPNLVALAICTIAGFFLSFLWYTPLFGKAWAKEMGFDPSATPPTAQFMKSLALTLISVFLMSLVLANNIAAWTPSSWGLSNANLSKPSQALQAGIFTWLGFFVPNLLQGVAWERRSWKLFAIDAGYYLTLMLLIAFIVVYMR
jgi:hypothetical protein